MSKQISERNVLFSDTNRSLQNFTQNKNEKFSVYKSASRRRRGLFDTLRGSQSSNNARITRIQAHPFLASPRGPPRVGPNNPMLQSGSRNSLRNVIKNDVFK